MTASLISFIIRLAPELTHLCVTAHIFMFVGLFVFILLSAMQCLQELHATCIFAGFHKSVGLQTLVLSFQHRRDSVSANQDSGQLWNCAQRTRRGMRKGKMNRVTMIEGNG